MYTLLQLLLSRCCHETLLFSGTPSMGHLLLVIVKTTSSRTSLLNTISTFVQCLSFKIKFRDGQLLIHLVSTPSYFDPNLFFEYFFYRTICSRHAASNDPIFDGSRTQDGIRCVCRHRVVHHSWFRIRGRIRRVVFHVLYTQQSPNHQHSVYNLIKLIPIVSAYVSHRLLSLSYLPKCETEVINIF